MKSSQLMQSLTSERLFTIIQNCAQLPEVKKEVLQNHDDNRWWSIRVTDWRLRMVIAGWSTRISYNSIGTYQAVVTRTNSIGYDDLCKMHDEEIASIVKSLGLSQTRVDYFRSVQKFIDQLLESGKDPLTLPNDELIELITKNVKGSGYKVAQCAALYAKGYHCGIFPVDSGMKDMLGPCIGLNLPSGLLGNEVMRKHIEKLLNTMPERLLKLARDTGYGALNLPANTTPVWWAHLVLIYFKRRYCNTHKPFKCPLREINKIGQVLGTMCDKNNPQKGGFKYVWRSCR